MIRRAFGTVVLLLLIDGLIARPANGDITIVALDGRQAPQLDPGVNFSNPGTTGWVINNAGHVAFVDSLAGTGVSTTNERALFAGPTGDLSLVAREDAPAPGLPEGVLYAHMGFPFISSNGHVLFDSTLRGTGVTSSNDEAIFSGTPGNVVVIARENDPVPGAGEGVTFRSFSGSQVNGQGHVAFNARLRGTGVASVNENTAWIWTPAGLTMVARGDTQVPGLPVGVKYNVPAIPHVNDDDEIWIRGTLRGTGVGSSNDEPILFGSPPALSLVLREGSAAPAMPAGVNIASFQGQNSYNKSGQITFGVSLGGTGITTSNNFAIYHGTAGAFQILAREDEQAPSAEAGAVFDSFVGSGQTPTVINAAGMTVFGAKLRGAGVTADNDTGVWVGTPGNVSLLAREGDAAPGTAAGTTFNHFGNPPIMNANGEVVFIGDVLTPSGEGSNGHGIWRGTPGNLSLVVEKFDALTVAPGDVRTISTLSLDTRSIGSGNEDNQASQFNDAGQLLVRVTFSNSTDGLFLFGDSSPPTLIGDLDDDGDVDRRDAALLATHFGELSGAGDEGSDLDGDGDVDLHDWGTLQNHLGDTLGESPLAAPVPEPSALALLVAFAAIAASRAVMRRR
jgi:hypothetical protein